MDTVDSLSELQRKMGRCAGGGGDGGDGCEGGRVSTGNALASFLPGVTLAISKLLTTRTNLGQVS